MVFAGIEPTPEELQAYYGRYAVHDQVSPVTIKRFHELLDRFEPYRLTGRIIDVGCGAGHFLECAAKRGWEVCGTEYGGKALAAARARNIRVLEGPLDLKDHPPAAFDVVCSFEVVEHITHPLQEWARMAQLLRPGGILYATTPNYNCAGHLLAGKHWSIVNFPEHLNYFTPRTLNALARASGLQKAWMETTGVIPNRVLYKPGSTADRRARVESSQEDLRSLLEEKMALNLLKKGVNALLNLTRTGDSMKGAFFKP